MQYYMYMQATARVAHPPFAITGRMRVPTYRLRRVSSQATATLSLAEGYPRCRPWGSLDLTTLRYSGRDPPRLLLCAQADVVPRRIRGPHRLRPAGLRASPPTDGLPSREGGVGALALRKPGRQKQRDRRVSRPNTPVVSDPARPGPYLPRGGGGVVQGSGGDPIVPTATAPSGTNRADGAVD